MSNFTADISGAVAYLNDVVVTGRTREEHDANVFKLFQRLQDYGMCVRREKCHFAKPNIVFLGFIVDAEGRRPDPEKIAHMPPLQDVKQLESYLGMVSFYSSFVPRMRSLRGPLDALKKKDTPFIWSKECREAFDRLREVLTSDLLLCHYDPKKPIIVAADASNYGIGAVISHRYPDGSEKVVCHASRALTAPERNYSQIEKEGLALVFAVKKFHRLNILEAKASDLSGLSKKYREDAKALNRRSIFFKIAVSLGIFGVILLIGRFIIF